MRQVRKRFSRKSNMTVTTISYEFWLVFDENGNVKSGRTDPKLSAGERSMFLRLDVPRSLFKKPALRGSIVVNDDAARDAVISKIEGAASKVLKEQLGLEFNLTVARSK